MEVLVHKKTSWQNKIAQAQDRIDAIDEIIGKLETTVPPVKLHKMSEDERALLLSQMACLDLNLHSPIGRDVLSEALWL